MTDTLLENSLPAQIRIAADQLGVSLWRNNSGVATNRDGRPVRFGLGNDSVNLNRTMKSSDWIGIGPDGRFIALELKRPGWIYRATEREIAQLNFHLHVRRKGGIAGFVTCVEDMLQLFRGRYL